MKIQNIFVRDSRVSVYEKISLCIIFMSDAIVTIGKFSPAGVCDFIAVFAASFLSLLAVPPALFIIRRGKNNAVLRFFAASVSAAGIAVSLAVFSDFIKKCAIPELNGLIIPTAILLTSFYSAFRNMNALTRAVHVVIPFAALFSAAAVLIASSRARSENIFYIIKEINAAPERIVLSTLAFAAVFAVKIILILYLFSFTDDTRGDRAAVCTGTLIYGTAISIMLLTAGAVLGAGLYTRLDYPLYYPLGLTELGNYFERTEIISVVVFMTLLVFKTGIFIRIIFAAFSVRKQAH